jgi:hypothetical protein
MLDYKFISSLDLIDFLERLLWTSALLMEVSFLAFETLQPIE